MELLDFWNKEDTFMEFLGEDLIRPLLFGLAASTLILLLIAWVFDLVIFLLIFLPLSYLYILIGLLRFRNKMKSTGKVTIYVPMGQSPPVIMGDGDYTLVYYEPEVEEDDQNES